ETPYKARPEADSDAVAAAGDQAAADVDARTLRPPEPGNGREPAARRSADRGAAAGRGRRRAGENRHRATRRQNRHVGRPGLRVLLRRLSRRRLPPAGAPGSQRAPADREYAVDDELAVRSPDVAALDADRRCADARDWRGDHRESRR